MFPQCHLYKILHIICKICVPEGLEPPTTMESHPEWAINKQVHFGIDLHWFYEVVLPDLR